MATESEKAGAEATNQTVGHDQDPKKPVVYDATNKHGIGVGEAADMYGDIQTAEQYGYVERVCPFQSGPSTSSKF
jgi:hypothetical protein